MTTRFDACRTFTMAQEGGYSDDRNDTGNWLKYQFIGSCYGVTPAALLRCVGEAHLPPVTAAFMRNLPAADAAAVYLSFWAAMGCEALPRGADLMVFDFGFNAGEQRSVRLLQQALGFPIPGDPRTVVDGFSGAATALHASRAAPRGLVHALHDAQALFYQGRPQFSRYGTGWLARTKRRRDAALAMVPPL